MWLRMVSLLVFLLKTFLHMLQITFSLGSGRLRVLGLLMVGVLAWAGVVELIGVIPFGVSVEVGLRRLVDNGEGLGVEVKYVTMLGRVDVMLVSLAAFRVAMWSLVVSQRLMRFSWFLVSCLIFRVVPAIDVMGVGGAVERDLVDGSCRLFGLAL